MRKRGVQDGGASAPRGGDECEQERVPVGLCRAPYSSSIELGSPHLFLLFAWEDWGPNKNRPSVRIYPFYIVWSAVRIGNASYVVWGTQSLRCGVRSVIWVCFPGVQEENPGNVE